MASELRRDERLRCTLPAGSGETSRKLKRMVTEDDLEDMAFEKPSQKNDEVAVGRVAVRRAKETHGFSELPTCSLTAIRRSSCPDETRAQPDELFRERLPLLARKCGQTGCCCLPLHFRREGREGSQ